MNAEPLFSPTISNEQLALMPTIHFEGEIIIVDTEKVLLEACDDLSQQQIIGFDTESRPSFKAGVTNKVALLQLSTPERCYLIRLCRIPMKRPLLRLLENRHVLKIGADVAGDIRALNQLRHFRAGGFVDLQAIAPQWGIEEKSLRKLSAITLGKRVSKAQRLSNWEAARLTQQQLSYAATDAWVCLEILNTLSAVPQLSGKIMHTDTESMSDYAGVAQQTVAAKPSETAKRPSSNATNVHHTKTVAKLHRRNRTSQPEQNTDKHTDETSTALRVGNTDTLSHKKSNSPYRTPGHATRKPKRRTPQQRKNTEQTK